MPQTEEKPRDLWTDAEFILAYGRIAQMRATPVPVYLGKLQRPGWSGPLKMYLVWCESCRVRPNKGFTVTHEQGYDRRVECGYCQARYDHLLPSRRAKDMALNPHHHPWLIAALCLAAIMLALALR